MVKSKPIALEHTIPCSQADAISHLIEGNQKLTVIITGNGDPAKGIVAQVALISERQQGVLVSLDKINRSLDKFDTKTNGLLDEISIVRSKLSIFKSEVTGKEAGIKKAEDKLALEEAVAATRKRDFYWRVATFITLIVAVMGLYLTIHKNNIVLVDTNTKVTTEINELK